jgi:predicted DNA-binding transcriptional regulator AlpA
MSSSILRLPELIAYTGLSRSAIYDRMDENSPRYDQSFPKQIKLGGNAIGWKKCDIDLWIDNCKNPKIETPHGPRQDNKARKPKPVKKAASPKADYSTHELLPDDLAPALQFTEQFIASLKQNEYLKSCLRLDAWTPVMAALLSSGIKATPGCTEIPCEGEGIDGGFLGASDSRFRLARSILKEWEDQFIDFDDDDVQYRVGDSPSGITPLAFFIWCDESQIDTDWLRLLREVAGCPIQGSVRHFHTRLGMQVSQSLSDSQPSSAGDVATNGLSHNATTEEAP